DVAINAAMSGVPMRIVPRNLVSLKFFEFLRDGGIDEGREFGKLAAAIGFFAVAFSFLGCAIGDPRVFHETIVAQDRQNIGRIESEAGSEFETKWSKPGLAGPERFAIEKDFCDLANAFKFDKDLSPFDRIGQSESLPVPSATRPLVLFAAMPARGPIVKSIAIIVSVRR